MGTADFRKQLQDGKLKYLSGVREYRIQDLGGIFCSNAATIFQDAKTDSSEHYINEAS